MSWCEQPFTGLGATSDSGGDVNGGDKNTCVGVYNESGIVFSALHGHM